MCDTLSKIVLTVLNGAFLLISLAMIGVGIALIADPEGLFSFTESLGLDLSTISEITGEQFDNILKAGGIFMIALGVITGIISIVGFCGAMRKSSILLNIYAILIIVIVAAEVALIIFVVRYPDTLTKEGGKVMEKALLKSFKSDVQVDTASGVLRNTSLAAPDIAWMVAQFKLKCCGGNSSADYSKFQWKNCGARCANGVVPASCCILKAHVKKHELPKTVYDFENFDLCMTPTGEDYRHSTGCWSQIVDKIDNAFNKYGTIAIVITAIIICVEIVLVIMACCAKE